MSNASMILENLSKTRSTSIREDQESINEAASSPAYEKTFPNLKHAFNAHPEHEAKLRPYLNSVHKAVEHINKHGGADAHNSEYNYLTARYHHNADPDKARVTISGGVGEAMEKSTMHIHPSGRVSHPSDEGDYGFGDAVNGMGRRNASGAEMKKGKHVPHTQFHKAMRGLADREVEMYK